MNNPLINKYGLSNIYDAYKEFCDITYCFKSIKFLFK